MYDLKKVLVACRNSSGEADMFSCTVEVTEGQYDLGEHYVLAEAIAIAEGYEAPFVCYDQSEQKNIAKHVQELNCPIPCNLEDKSTSDSTAIKANVVFGWDGLSIQIDGYSDYSSEDNGGIVVYLESWGRSVNLRAYADINCEEPTDVINLDGARNECRVPTDSE